MKEPFSINDWQEPAEDPRVSRERLLSKVRLLWENRIFLLRILFWCGLASTLIVFLIPKRYDAVTRLMPPDNQASLGPLMAAALPGQGSSGLGSFAGDLLGIKNSGALFTGILQSQTVQDRLIKQFNLKELYRDRLIEDARLDLAAHTGISEDRKSGILTISVSDKDPRRAAAMATAYVTELDRLVAQVSTSSARRERLFLEERLQNVKRDLDAASGKFSEFASKNTAIDIPAQGKAMVEAAARLQGELIAAESELRGLQAIYTAQNVRVRSAQARVSELRTQLEKLGGTGQELQDSSSSPSSIYPSIRKLPVLGVTYADLYRQTKIQETVFELLTRQYELAKVQEAKEIPSVKILDAAVVPTKKSFPPRLLLIAVSTFASLLLASAWLIAKEIWRGIPPEDSRKQFAFEIGNALQGDLARLAPQESLRGRALARVGLSGNGASAVSNAEEKTESPEKTREVARAARSSGS
jgi:capsule polysaccharide export protein KpsE/RkpR